MTSSKCGLCWSLLACWKILFQGQSSLATSSSFWHWLSSPSQMLTKQQERARLSNKRLRCFIYREMLTHLYTLTATQQLQLLILAKCFCLNVFKGKQKLDMVTKIPVMAFALCDLSKLLNTLNLGFFQKIGLVSQ